MEPTLSDYQNAARKIRSIYADAYPEAVTSLPSDDNVDKFVSDLRAMHPSLSPVRFWRALMTALIAHFDDHMEGNVRPTAALYDNVIQRLRED